MSSKIPKYNTSINLVMAQIEDIQKNDPNKNITYEMISEMIKNMPQQVEKKLTKEQLEKQEALFLDFCDF
jgi:hypothetical protein